MSDDNRVSGNLTDVQIQTIIQGVTDIRALLTFLISLSDEDRQTLPKLGAKSIGFHEKCQAYMTNNPEFIPGYLNMTEVHADTDLRTQMLRVLPAIKTLADAVEDTMIGLGSDIYQADLAYYQSVREAARRNRPGAEIIYNDLKARFPGYKPQSAAAAAAAAAKAAAAAAAAPAVTP